LAEATYAQTPRPPAILERGNVVTIEPGLYVCSSITCPLIFSEHQKLTRDSYFPIYPLRAYYLRDPIFSKYINVSVLNHYWAVGGIRIEDDFLVTEDGYENLTTTPKGEEMLKIIREGWRKRKEGMGKQ